MSLRDEYLRRVGLTAFPAATAEGLRALHEAQVYAIPFENLSPLLGEPVIPEVEPIFDKVVRKRRGGYCFELNGLFAYALGEAGFRFEPCLARVQYRRPAPGPLTHLLAVVQTGGREWIADVGFGGPGLHRPLPLEEGYGEEQDGIAYRVARSPEFGWCVEAREQGEEGWTKLYHFTRARVYPMDIALGNHFTSTSETTVFRNALVLARHREGGRVNVRGREVIHTGRGAGPREVIETAADLARTLREVFGIEPPAGEDRLAQVLERVKKHEPR